VYSRHWPQPGSSGGFKRKEKSDARFTVLPLLQGAPTTRGPTLPVVPQGLSNCHIGRSVCPTAVQNIFVINHEDMTSFPWLTGRGPLSLIPDKGTTIGTARLVAPFRP
jgi:hypothetical protein